MLRCQTSRSHPPVSALAGARGTKSGCSYGGSIGHAVPWKGSRGSRRSRRCTAIIGRFQPTSAERVGKRVSELATRELYLLNFWYAAGFGKQLKKDSFLTTTLLDTPVLLWRSQVSDRVHCTRDQCPRTGQNISSLLTKPPTTLDDNGLELMYDALDMIGLFSATVACSLFAWHLIAARVPLQIVVTHLTLTTRPRFSFASRVQ